MLNIRGIYAAELEYYIKAIANNDLEYTEVEFGYLGAETVVGLAEALEGNKTLASLNIMNSTINPASAKALAKALEKNKTLNSLNLASNNIGPQGAIALAGALEKNKTLTSLGLASNNIGPQGAIALAGALEKNKTLTNLDLCFNNIGSEGVIALAGALEKNNTLTNLSLGQNEIGLAGAIALAGALEKNKTLTSLNLFNCRIGPEGTIALAGALEKNKTLTSLDLQYNEIGPEGIAALVEALEKNKYILKLEITPSDERTTQLLERNRQFLLEAIDVVKTNTLANNISDLLSAERKQTLFNNLNDDSEEGVKRFPLELRKKFSQFIAAELLKSGEQWSRSHNSLVRLEISSFIPIDASHTKVVNTPKSTDYFRDLTLKLSAEDEKSVEKMLIAAGDLKDLMQKHNNIDFVKKAWKKDKSFEEFATNLKTINENKETCEFVKKHPNTLGYFVTLEPEKLAKTLESLRDPNLASILGKNYAFIKEASNIDIDTNDLDTRLRLAYVNQVSPPQSGETLTTLLNCPDKNFAKRVRQENNPQKQGSAR